MKKYNVGQVPLYFVGFTRSGKGARKFFIKEKVLVTFKAKEEGFSFFFFTHNQDFPWEETNLPSFSCQFLHLNPWAVPSVLLPYCVDPIRKHFNHPWGVKCQSSEKAKEKLYQNVHTQLNRLMVRPTIAQRVFLQPIINYC